MPMQSVTNIQEVGQRQDPFRPDRVAVANGLLFLSSLGLFVGYLCLCTFASENGYKLRDAEKRVMALTEQRQRQSMTVLSEQALGNVDRRVQALGFVPVTKVQYVNAMGAVALR